MQVMIRAQLARIDKGEIVRLDSESTYQCTRCNEPAVDEIRPRSLWVYGLGGGLGEVTRVRHLFCPSCHPEEQAPNEQGAQEIYDIELMEVDDALMPSGGIFSKLQQAMLRR